MSDIVFIDYNQHLKAWFLRLDSGETLREPNGQTRLFAGMIWASQWAEDQGYQVGHYVPPADDERQMALL